MYKILIRYTSSSKKVFWQSYMTTNEEGEIVEFSTDDINKLRKEIKKLDSKIGYDNIKAIKDVTYSILIDVSEDIDLENAEIATPNDVNNVYSTAYEKVFGGN